MLLQLEEVRGGGGVSKLTLLTVVPQCLTFLDVSFLPKVQIQPGLRFQLLCDILMLQKNSPLKRVGGGGTPPEALARISLKEQNYGNLV